MNNIKIVCTIGMLFFASLLNSAKAETVNIIKNIRVVADTFCDGTTGVYIEYNVDFSEVKKKTGRDTLFNDFKINFTIKNAKKSDGTNTICNDRTTIVDSSVFTKNTKTAYFIPYVIMDMDEKKHSVNMRLSVYSLTPEFKRFEQVIDLENILINDRKYFTVSLNIESIRVCQLRQRWFEDMEPDLIIQICVGNGSVWKKKGSENSFSYVGGFASHNIKFKIAQGDKFQIMITDDDWFNDDFIGAYEVAPTLADIGKTNTISEYFDQVAECKATWTVEEGDHTAFYYNKFFYLCLLPLVVIIIIVIYFKKNK